MLARRAAVYCRISRDDAGDGAGVARQEEDCLKLAAQRGWTVVRTFVDNDVSAYSGRRRPGYEQLLASARAGTVNAIVAWAPERLQRSVRELEDFIELVDGLGVAVETVKAGAWDVSTSHGKLVARMLGAVSRAESERLGERVSRAHRQARSQGLWRGPIPYGMRPSDRAGVPEVDPDAAPVVRQIIDRALKGDSLTVIARDLNDAGHRPRRGASWTHTGVLRLISSPAIGGMIRLDGELVPAAFEGVVIANRWRQVLATLERRPRGERRRPPEVLTLLGGIMVCDEHDAPCYGGSRDGQPVYTVNSATRCYIGVARAPVDAFIRDLVIARLKRHDAAAVLLRSPTREPLEGEASDLRTRRDELAELLGAGLLTASSARPQLEAIALRLNEIEAVTMASAVIDDEALADPSDAWCRWTMPQRREVVRVLFASIRLKHAAATGPRVDLSRVLVSWRT